MCFLATNINKSGEEQERGASPLITMRDLLTTNNNYYYYYYYYNYYNYYYYRLHCYVRRNDGSVT